MNIRHHTIDRAALEALSPRLAYPDFDGREHGVLNLAEESYDTFKLLNHFIVKGSLPTAAVNTLDELRHYEGLLISAWCFGYRYQVPKFQNAVMHDLIGLLQSRVDIIFHIQYTVHQVPIDTPLGRLLLEKFVLASRKFGPEVQAEHWDYYDKLPSSREFVAALGAAFAEYERDPMKLDGELGDAVRGSYMVDL